MERPNPSGGCDYKSVSRVVAFEAQQVCVPTPPQPGGDVVLETIHRHSDVVGAKPSDAGDPCAYVGIELGLGPAPPRMAETFGAGCPESPGLNRRPAGRLSHLGRRGAPCGALHPRARDPTPTPRSC